MRWSEESDFSDNDYDAEATSPPAGSYCDAVRRGSPAQDALEAGTSSQPHTYAIDEQPVEAAQKGILCRPTQRKRGKRKWKPRR